MSVSLRRIALKAGLVQAFGRFRRRRQTAEQVFGRIYAKRAWGEGVEAFYSGSGSDTEFGLPYADLIARELSAADAGETLVDLGCGDFRIGRLLLERLPVKYVGVDVVRPLIEHHAAHFGSARVSFMQRDIARDGLPDGDYCLVRQVLQHLSNDEIAATLPKLRKYRRVFITEHYPADETAVTPNRDMVHGGEVRSPRSAVYLDQPPFGSATSELLTLPWNGEKIRTIELLSQQD